MALLIPDASAEPLLNDLDYDNLSSSDQAKVDALIEAGSELIEKYCNRIFTAADYVEVQDGNGYNEIYVYNPPINSITSVIITSNTIDYTFVTAKLKTKNPVGRVGLDLDATDISDLFTHFPRGSQNITINYNGGFTTIPVPLRMVLADFTIRAFDSLGEEDYLSEKLGQYFYKVKEDKSRIDKKISQYEAYLQLYKIKRV